MYHFFKYSKKILVFPFFLFFFFFAPSTKISIGATRSNALKQVIEIRYYDDRLNTYFCFLHKLQIQIPADILISNRRVCKIMNRAMEKEIVGVGWNKLEKRGEKLKKTRGAWTGW